MTYLSQVFTKFSLLLALVAGFLFISLNTVQAAELFSDGFEADFSQWSGIGSQWRIITSSGAHSGTKRAHAEGPSTGSFLTKDLSTVGYEDINLSFWYKVAGLEETDQIVVDYSADGGVTWEDEVMIFQDGVLENVSEWTLFSANLGNLADNNPDFVLRFSLSTDTASDNFDLDDVIISGNEIQIIIDSDSDGVEDSVDNCPYVPNLAQANFDDDEFGDACDSDYDNDGILNIDENEGCEFDTNLSCGAPLDEDNDGIIEGDLCPNTVADFSGVNNLKPNHWQYNGISWMKGLSNGKGENNTTYTISDTKGCGCDQIIDFMSLQTGESYTGHTKFGCSAGLIEDFMQIIW